MSKNVIELLQARGLLDATTSEELIKHVQNPVTVYIGFDPTADSLHLGNLMGMVVLRWFQKCGHTPVALVGGATGRIGDPSGRSLERPLLSDDEVRKNLLGIRKNFSHVLDFSHPSASPIFMDNYDWFSHYGFLDFLRDIGKHFRLSTMLAKESVRTRLESEEGLSFTEFSYQLLQAYDFLHLFDHYKVSVQLGGSDQWGNITAGVDLVRRLRGKPVYGMTFPLLTQSDGKKFGKSEQGAIWLSGERLSPYELYQYLYRIADTEVIRLLRCLTFMELDEISWLEQRMQQPDYEPNTAQKRLAEEITRLVHSQEGVALAERITAAAKPGKDTLLNAEVLESVSEEMPHINLAQDAVVDQKLMDVVLLTGLLPSKGEIKRLIKNGGLYLNNKKVQDELATISQQDLIDNRMLLLAIGKKTKLLIRIV